MNKALYILLLSLIAVCIFDPADFIFHLKLPLFCMCWAVFVLNMLIAKARINLPYKLLSFLFFLLLIPLVSITYYNAVNGGEPYNGYLYFKSYFFATIMIVLYVSGINLIKPLCIILLVLSCVIIAIFILTSSNPAIETAFYALGGEYGNLALGRRSYGGINFPTIFYKTSPMIAISIAYYVFRSIKESGKNALLYVMLSVICIFAMFLAGTRNNIIIAIGLPLLILFWYSKRKIIICALSLLLVILLSITFHEVIMDMFSPSDVSNETKIAYLSDYGRVFSEPSNLLIGQGLGAYNYWNILGEETSITELTFLEIFRNYGLILGIGLLLLMFYPLKDLFIRQKIDNHYLALGYASYLLMSVSNPFFFSSSGMLIFSIIATNTLCAKMHKTSM